MRDFFIGFGYLTSATATTHAATWQAMHVTPPALKEPGLAGCPGTCGGSLSEAAFTCSSVFQPWLTHAGRLPPHPGAPRPLATQHPTPRRTQGLHRCRRTFLFPCRLFSYTDLDHQRLPILQCRAVFDMAVTPPLIKPFVRPASHGPCRSVPAHPPLPLLAPVCLTGDCDFSVDPSPPPRDVLRCAPTLETPTPHGTPSGNC